MINYYYRWLGQLQIGDIGPSRAVLGHRQCQASFDHIARNCTPDNEAHSGALILAPSHGGGFPRGMFEKGPGNV